MCLDSGSSMPVTSSGLGDVSAISPFIDAMVEFLHPLFDSGTVDPMVDPRAVDTKAIRNTFIQLYKWSKDLENAKFLNANPVEKASILK